MAASFRMMPSRCPSSHPTKRPSFSSTSCRISALTAVIPLPTLLPLPLESVADAPNFGPCTKPRNFEGLAPKVGGVWVGCVMNHHRPHRNASWRSKPSKFEGLDQNRRGSKPPTAPSPAPLTHPVCPKNPVFTCRNQFLIMLYSNTGWSCQVFFRICLTCGSKQAAITAPRSPRNHAASGPI